MRKMQFAVIGLGRFGSSLAKQLMKLGYEVLAVTGGSGSMQNLPLHRIGTTSPFHFGEMLKFEKCSFLNNHISIKKSTSMKCKERCFSLIYF